MKKLLVGTDNDFDNTQLLDSQTEALRSMIRSLLEAQLRPIREQIACLETEEEAGARYVELRARLAKTQEGLDLLNHKFDALADEVWFLRKSARLPEDRVDSLPVEAPTHNRAEQHLKEATGNDSKTDRGAQLWPKLQLKCKLSRRN